MHFTNWVSNNIFYITLIRSHSPPIISPLFDFFDAQSIWTDLEYLIAIIIKILVLILRMNKIFVLSVANCLFLNIEQKPPKLINDQSYSYFLNGQGPALYKCAYFGPFSFCRLLDLQAKLRTA